MRQRVSRGLLEEEKEADDPTENTLEKIKALPTKVPFSQGIKTVPSPISLINHATLCHDVLYTK